MVLRPPESGAPEESFRDRPLAFDSQSLHVKK